MIYLNNITELFEDICIYEVTKDTCLYSVLENTPKAIELIKSFGLPKGAQSEEYNEKCPYIWIRTTDWVYSNVVRGGQHIVRWINGIPCRMSNDKYRETNLELTIKRK